MATEHLLDPSRAKAPIRMPGSYKPSVKDHYLKALIMGNPGVGKTTTATSALAVPEMCDVLFLNVEKGTLAITDLSAFGIFTPA